MKVPGLNYNTNSGLQESPIILPNSKPSFETEHEQQQQPQPSTKKVWRLKKYHRSEDEIKTQQKNYENLEFNTKKTSSRRPKNKNGQQEFVFVDLSPTKKGSSTPKESESSPSTTTQKKQGNRVSRLFRLNTASESALPKNPSPIPSSARSPPRPTLMSSPDLPDLPPLPQSQPINSQRQKVVQPIPRLAPSSQALPPPIQPPQLKRSYTTANAARYLERSTSSASLVMTVSENGRAVLQPCQAPSKPTISRTLSTSSSVSDMYSLSRANSARQSPIPSPPRRTISPLHAQHLDTFSDYGGSQHEDEDEQSDEPDYEFGAAEADATKAFSRVIKRQASFRKRANTASSNNSIVSSSSPVVPRLLTRNQSISSMNSAYKSRISPSRSSMMLRQSALLPLPQPHFTQQQAQQQPLYSPHDQPNDFNFSFFDDLQPSLRNNNNSHKKTSSITESITQLGPPLEINSSDNDPESPYTTNTDVMYPFEFGNAGLDHTHPDNADEQHHQGNTSHFDDTFKTMTSHDHTIGPDTLSGFEENGQSYFDFNAFINYEDQHF